MVKFSQFISSLCKSNAKKNLEKARPRDLESLQNFTRRVLDGKIKLSSKNIKILEQHKTLLRNIAAGKYKTSTLVRKSDEIQLFIKLCLKNENNSKVCTCSIGGMGSVKRKKIAEHQYGGRYQLDSSPESTDYTSEEDDFYYHKSRVKPNNPGGDSEQKQTDSESGRWSSNKTDTATENTTNVEN